MASAAATPAIGFTGGGSPGSSMSVDPGDKSSRPQRQNAELLLVEPKAGKGGIVEPSDKQLGSIRFQFNPKEVTIAKSAKWDRKAAKSAKKSGPPEFNGAEPCKLTFEMFFDATGKHEGGVVQNVEMLFRCCVPTKESADTPKPMPPLVLFQWGSVTSFPAYVTQVSAKYTLFAADGTPIRAVCSVSLEEVPKEPKKQNPTSGALSVRRVHTVVDGDTLASVAYHEYGDAELWRPLARFNDIDDPLDLACGQVVLVPAVEDLLPASAR